MSEPDEPPRRSFSSKETLTLRQYPLCHTGKAKVVQDLSAWLRSKTLSTSLVLP